MNIATAIQGDSKGVLESTKGHNFAMWHYVDLTFVMNPRSAGLNPPITGLELTPKVLTPAARFPYSV